jgi:hypothetical protein
VRILRLLALSIASRRLLTLSFWYGQGHEIVQLIGEPLELIFSFLDVV